MMQLPNAWASSKRRAIQAASTKKVTARIDMSAEVAGAGLCPECHGKMDKAFVNDYLVYVCNTDRIAIPIANE